MHFNASIPDVKVMLAQVMAWDFIAIAAHYRLPNKGKLDCVTVGKLKSSVHDLNLY